MATGARRLAAFLFASLWLSLGVRVAAGSVQLFVDDHVIERMDGLERVLHEPVRREVALVLDRPWEGAQSGYATVLRDSSGEFRMCYRGGGDLSREVTCLATSENGIDWERPNLGLVEFEGSPANNILWTAQRPSYGESHNFSPFVDTNPAASSAERCKAVGLVIAEDESGERRKMLGVLGSPDGIAWHWMAEGPVIRQGSFDSLNVALWDPALGRYACYSRVGRDGLRSIQRSLSDDFLAWDPPEPLVFDPPQTHHLYTNGITLYPRCPGLLLGFPMRFVPERTAIGPEGREIDGTSDGLFMTSRDGLHWRVWPTAFLRPGRDPDNWGEAHGNSTIATGLLQTAPDELSLYWLENCADVPQMRRGTLRLDGFVSLRAGAEPGELLTRPLAIDGQRLVLNMATSAAGGVRMEIQDAEGVPIPGFTLEECPEIFGDEIARPVAWGTGADLSSLAGREVRLRVALRDADLYSFAFE